MKTGPDGTVKPSSDRRLRPAVLVGATFLIAAAIGLAVTLWQRDAATNAGSPPTPVEIPAEGPVSIALAGDVSLAPVDAGTEPRYDLGPLGAIVADATLGFANLETTLLDDEAATAAAARPAPRWLFASPRHAPALRALGLDLVSLANNHALDYGAIGLASTRRALDAAGVRYAGAGDDLAAARAPVVVGGGARRVALVAVTASASPESRASASQQDIRGRPGVSALTYAADITVDAATFNTLAQSVVSMNAGPPPGERELTMFGTLIKKGERTTIDFRVSARDEQDILDRVRAARAQAEIVVVSVHSHEPSNASEEPADFMRAFAHAAVDAGAHLVVGHGPHRVRGAEIYKGALIFYSLGNFLYPTDGIDFRAADFFDAGKDLYSVALGASADSSGAAQLGEDWWWEGIVAVPVFETGRLTGARIYAVELRGEPRSAGAGVPRLAQGDRAGAILRRFSMLSAAFGTQAELGPAGDVLVVPISKFR